MRTLLILIIFYIIPKLSLSQQCPGKSLCSQGQWPQSLYAQAYPDPGSLGTIYTAVLHTPDVREDIYCYWEYYDNNSWVIINGLNERTQHAIRVTRSGDYRFSYYCYYSYPNGVNSILSSAILHVQLTPRCGVWTAYCQPYQTIMNQSGTVQMTSNNWNTSLNGVFNSMPINICNDGNASSLNVAKLEVLSDDFNNTNPQKTYVWSPNTNIVSSPANYPNIIYVSPPSNSGTTIYTCAVSDINGCSQDVYFRIQENGHTGNFNLNIVSPDPAEAFCEGSQFSLCATPNNGIYTFDFYGSPPITTFDSCHCFNAPLVPNCQNPQIPYTIYVHDFYGCGADISSYIYSVDRPNFVLGPGPADICSGEPVNLYIAYIDPQNTACYNTTWTWPGNTQTNVNSIPTQYPTTSTIYTVDITNTPTINGQQLTCANTRTYSVHVDQQFNAQISTLSNDYCKNGPIALVASGGSQTATYHWSSNPSASNITNPNASNTTSTPPVTGSYVYTVVVDDGACHSTTYTQPVTIHPLPVVQIAPIARICPNALASVDLHAQQAMNYQWSTGTTGPTLHLAPPPTASTVYTVTGTDHYGNANCSATDSYQLDVYPIITPTVWTDESEFCLNSHDVIHVMVSGGAPGQTYTWSPQTGITNISLNTILINTDLLTNPTTTYTVTSVDVNGCAIKKDDIIIINKGDCGALINQNDCNDCISSFSPVKDKWYVLSTWVKENNDGSKTSYSNPVINIYYTNPPNGAPAETCLVSGEIIDGWQRIEKEFKVPSTAAYFVLSLESKDPAVDVYFDDIRISPKDGTMKTFVYDPVTLRLVAELDERNYATFYEYDEDGALVRVKKETERGVVTINESRTNIQKP